MEARAKKHESGTCDFCRNYYFQVLLQIIIAFLVLYTQRAHRSSCRLPPAPPPSSSITLPSVSKNQKTLTFSFVPQLSHTRVASVTPLLLPPFEIPCSPGLSFFSNAIPQRLPLFTGPNSVCRGSKTWKLNNLPLSSSSIASTPLVVKLWNLHSGNTRASHISIFHILLLLYLRHILQNSVKGKTLFPWFNMFHLALFVLAFFFSLSFPVYTS